MKLRGLFGRIFRFYLGSQLRDHNTRQFYDGKMFSRDPGKDLGCKYSRSRSNCIYNKLDGYIIIHANNSI